MSDLQIAQATILSVFALLGGEVLADAEVKS